MIIRLFMSFRNVGCSFYFVQIVEPFSCIIGDASELVQTLDGNHRSMCKYGGTDDDNYNKVYQVVSGYVQAIEVEICVRSGE